MSKISFGFSKIQKKPTPLGSRSGAAQKPPENVQFITSFDRKAPPPEEKPALSIPVRDSDGVAKRIEAARKRKENGETHEIQAIGYETKKRGDGTVNVIPLKDALTGGAEETAESADYDNVPVTDFGLAMLRGMGWAPGKGIGKKQKVVEYRAFELRPRGLGLGADPDAVVKAEKEKEKAKSEAKEKAKSETKEKAKK